MGSPVKQTELYGSLLKDAMKVQAVIPAVMVVVIPMAPAVIPNALHLLYALWFFPV